MPVRRIAGLPCVLLLDRCDPNRMNEHSRPRIWTHARIATLAAGARDYGVIEDAALICDGERIAWLGPMAEFPSVSAAEIVDLEGRWITPGLVDCHTHLVYGGDRAAEFEMRLEGASYEDIAKAGGGILSTLKATRTADEASLRRSALKRLDALLSEGATTVEIKSGYGLDRENETKMLRVARSLEAERAVSVVTTFLGAHALPPEAEGDKDAYIDNVCKEQLPAIAAEGLADAVDAFCEKIAFDRDQTRRVFETAKALGLPIKIHAEQLSNLGGAKLAAEMGALSADHLEYLDEDGVAAMAQSGTVAVLLPGAFYFLRETKFPPVGALRAAGVPLAIATDANPGSSPLTSLLTAMNMACTLFGLTPLEALAGVTVNAARALGLGEDRGSLAPGKRCDLAIWEIEQPAELAYRIGFNPLYARVWRGQ
jgi:imidazolonepropionase